ncbi:type VII secretion protein EccE [Dactylosporangium sp. CS-047395]|uniref:type VII secretion protein EccE n=1 Tax=Dactylosporangium sp. CS-047395 TaxID=3239936 RepID=UPI003D90AE63
MTEAADRPQPRRRAGYVGGVHLGRLVLAEAVVLAIAALVPHGPIATGIAAVAGVAVLLVAVLRRRGRWWLEQRALTREHHRRRAATSVDALHALAPGLVVREVPGATADGPRVGIGCDAGGWYAAAVLGDGASLRGDADPGVPLDLLARVLDDEEHPGAVVQVTTVSVPAPLVEAGQVAARSHRELQHLGPGPAPLVEAGQVAARSYRELQHLGPGPALPAERTTWVAVRLDARVRAEAGLAAEYDAEHAPALVASLIRKAGRLLRDAGLEHRVLTGDGLTAALTRACELDGPAPQEDWTAWRSGGLAHAVLWMRTWPRLEHTSALLEHLLSLPSAASASSLILTLDGGGLALRGLIRVSAPAPLLEATARTITEAAAAAHADLVPLDGEHGPGMYACAPTGGGAT